MVYKRHTNFAIETHQVEFDGQADFGKRVVCNIGRNGDLLYNCFIVVYIPELTKKFLYSTDPEYNEKYDIYKSDGINKVQNVNKGIEYYYCNDTEKIKDSKINRKFLNQHEIVSWVNSIGHVIIDYVSIEIGGQEIDKHYGEWLEIWNELTIDSNKKNGFNNRMIGKFSDDEWLNKGIYYNANALRLASSPSSNFAD